MYCAAAVHLHLKKCNYNTVMAVLKINLLLQLWILEHRVQKLAACYQHAATMSKQQRKGGVCKPSC